MQPSRPDMFCGPMKHQFDNPLYRSLFKNYTIQKIA